MSMYGLPTFLKKISPLSEQAIVDIEAAITEKRFYKGAYLEYHGKVCQKLYFLNEGLVKLFFLKEEKEFIMRFFSEGALFTVPDSYFSQTRSTYAIQALEPLMTEYINHSAMEQLCEKHHCIETAFRKFIAVAAANMMSRVGEMLEENGSERYNNFIEINGPLLQRINLSDIASYLGITAVSLSRIRARK